MSHRIEFSVGKEKLVGDLHLPEGLKPFPCVITSHGYMSNRSSEKYFQIARRFPLEGIAVFRFDHRGALGGESDGEFEDTTLTRRVEDVVAAIPAVASHSEIDGGKLGLFGSSLGGMDVLLAQDERVKARVTLATPFRFPPPSDKARRSFQEKGYCEYAGGARIKKEFFEDFGRYDLKEAVGKTTCPLLIIHGTLDEQVPRHHAKVLFQAAGSESKELRMLAGGDHSLTDLNLLNEALGYTLDWFQRYLRNS